MKWIHLKTRETSLVWIIDLFTIDSKRVTITNLGFFIRLKIMLATMRLLIQKFALLQLFINRLKIKIFLLSRLLYTWKLRRGKKASKVPKSPGLWIYKCSCALLVENLLGPRQETKWLRNLDQYKVVEPVSIKS